MIDSDGVRLSRLQVRALELVQGDAELSQLNGTDLAAVLTSAAGAVTNAMTAQATAEAIRRSLSAFTAAT